MSDNPGGGWHHYVWYAPDDGAWQLRMYLGQKEGAECRLLRADLEAADERLRNKNWLIETQEELPDDAKTTIFC